MPGAASHHLLSAHFVQLRHVGFFERLLEPVGKALGDVGEVEIHLVAKTEQVELVEIADP